MLSIQPHTAICILMYTVGQKIVTLLFAMTPIKLCTVSIILGVAETLWESATHGTQSCPPPPMSVFMSPCKSHSAQSVHNRSLGSHG